MKSPKRHKKENKDSQHKQPLEEQLLKSLLKHQLKLPLPREEA
jgi:hypothetical protein